MTNDVSIRTGMFMRRWERITWRNPVGSGRILGLCVVDIVQGLESIRIMGIRSLEERRGYGTSAMTEVVALADEFYVPLQLTAQRFGKEKRMNTRQLIVWYQSFGFRRLERNSTRMYRLPSPQPHR